MPHPRTWLSAQFTVFGGHETLLQTAWCDPQEIAEDARVAAKDPRCRGFFQWPEWSATSPWLSHCLSKLGWDPNSFDTAEVLHGYALERHGELAEPFLEAFAVLAQAGNASYMVTPNKRLLIPFRLESTQHHLFSNMNKGLLLMVAALADTAQPKPLFERDIIDLAALLGVRLAQAWEIEGCLRFANGDQEGAAAAVQKALVLWSALERLLAQTPERSLFETVRLIASDGPLGMLESKFLSSTNFYKGYPLVFSTEGIRWVYRPQCEALLKEVESHQEPSGLPTLQRMPGWYWRDFPDPSWRDAVRVMPGADLEAFTNAMAAAIKEQIAEGQRSPSDAQITQHARLVEGDISPSVPRIRDRAEMLKEAKTIGAMRWPPALKTAPVWPTPPAK